MNPKLHLFCLALVVLLPPIPASGQVPDQLKYSIPAPPVGMQTSAQLGSSVAVDGNYTVCGAPFDDFGTIQAGVVKVFDSTTGALLFLIPNPDPAEFDYFGSSVAVSGTRVVVSAKEDDSERIFSGSVYVYDLSSGTPTVPVTTLNNPTPASYDNFGISVAISGTRVVVGADKGINPGSAYVYDLGSETPAVPVATLNNPTTAEYYHFGYAVAISGARVVVGAYGDFTELGTLGRAYVYDLSSGTSTVHVATLKNPLPEPYFYDYFGYSVAISGSRVVVGAFESSGGTTNYRGAFVYDLASGTPTVPVVALNNPSPYSTVNLRNSVAISGTRVLIGAYHDDTGATDAGSAYVYDLNSATPTVPVAALNNPAPAPFDYFGRSVAISDTRVVVGAPFDDAGATDAGTAYVYDLGGGTPTAPVATLNNSGPAAQDHFGNSVGISGAQLVVGAPYDDTGAADAGSVSVYDLAGSTPTL